MNILLEKIVAITKRCNLNAKKLGAHPQIVTFHLDRLRAALAEDEYLKNLGDEQQPILEELARKAQAERLKTEADAIEKAAKEKAANDARVLKERKAHEKRLADAEAIREAHRLKKLQDAANAKDKAALLSNAAGEIAKNQNGEAKPEPPAAAEQE